MENLSDTISQELCLGRGESLDLGEELVEILLLSGGDGGFEFGELGVVFLFEGGLELGERLVELLLESSVGGYLLFCLEESGGGFCTEPLKQSQHN